MKDSQPGSWIHNERWLGEMSLVAPQRVNHLWITPVLIFCSVRCRCSEAEATYKDFHSLGSCRAGANVLIKYHLQGLGTLAAVFCLLFLKLCCSLPPKNCIFISFTVQLKSIFYEDFLNKGIPYHFLLFN